VKKRVYGFAFVLLFLFLSVAGLLLAGLVVANAIPHPPVILPAITINNDGSISPQTELISRDGNTYSLTANIQDYPIVIACSNINFDGAGYTINITSGDNSGLKLQEVNNVTVKNVKVFSLNIYTIYLFHSNNCAVTRVQTGTSVRIVGNFNNITESNTGIYIFSGSNNLITRNNINDILVGGSALFFKNNFYLTDYPSLFVESSWDNGFIGNYWGNYTIKYPNASEVGNTGIGDTPYVIDEDNIDHYPLMYPYDIEKDAIALPTQEPLIEPATEPLSTPLIAGASIVTVIGVVVGLFYYQRHRREIKKNS